MRLKKLYKSFAFILATFGGTGYSPVMPGTAGSLAAFGIALILIHFGSLQLLFFLFLLSAVVGLWSSRVVLRHFKDRSDPQTDPQIIVIDEASGLWLALLFVPRPDDFRLLVVAFLLFRLFDMTKIYPVSKAEKNIKGALGIMADDWVAGIMAGIGSLFVSFLLPLF